MRCRGAAQQILVQRSAVWCCREPKSETPNHGNRLGNRGSRRYGWTGEIKSVWECIRSHRRPCKVRIATRGFMKRTFGSTLKGETFLMCGVSVKVHDLFEVLDDLNYKSSQALRLWRTPPTLAGRRAEMRLLYDRVKDEAVARGLPARGAQRGAKKGGKGKRCCPTIYSNWSDEDSSGCGRGCEDLNRIGEAAFGHKIDRCWCRCTCIDPASNFSCREFSLSDSESLQNYV